MDELSKWLDEMMPSITTGATMVAFIIAFSITVFRKVRKTLALLFNSKEDLDIKHTDIKKMADKLSDKVDEVVALQKDLTEAKEDIAKITKVLAIAYKTDAKMVSSGSANEIMKVLGCENEDEPKTEDKKAKILPKVSDI